MLDAAFKVVWWLEPPCSAFKRTSFENRVDEKCTKCFMVAGPQAHTHLSMCLTTANRIKTWGAGPRTCRKGRLQTRFFVFDVNGPMMTFPLNFLLGAKSTVWPHDRDPPLAVANACWALSARASNLPTCREALAAALPLLLLHHPPQKN